MANKVNQPSAEVMKLAETMKAHAGEKLTWAQLCELAGVENKTGYLAGLKKVLGDALTVAEKDVEVVVQTKRKVNSYTYNG